MFAAGEGELTGNPNTSKLNTAIQRRVALVTSAPSSSVVGKSGEGETTAFNTPSVIRSDVCQPE